MFLISRHTQGSQPDLIPAWGHANDSDLSQWQGGLFKACELGGLIAWQLAGETTSCDFMFNHVQACFSELDGGNIWRKTLDVWKRTTNQFGVKTVGRFSQENSSDMGWSWWWQGKLNPPSPLLRAVRRAIHLTTWQLVSTEAPPWRRLLLWWLGWNRLFTWFCCGCQNWGINWRFQGWSPLQIQARAWTMLSPTIRGF